MQYLGNKYTSPAAEKYFARLSCDFSKQSILSVACQYISLKRCDKNHPLIPHLKAISFDTELEELIKTYQPNNDIFIFFKDGGRQDEYLIRPDKCERQNNGWITYNDYPFPIDKFLSEKENKVRVYSNIELQTTFIFVQTMTYDLAHEKVASILPKVAPWLYKNGFESVPEEELNVFRALKNRDDKLFSELVDKYFDECNISELYLESVLDDVQENQITKQLKKAEIAVSNAAAVVRQRANDYTSALKTYNEQNLHLRMLEEAKQSQKHGRSLYKFFKQHKQLKFIGTGDDEYSNEQNVYFEICETLEYYDEEDLETLIANKYSIFYSNFTPFAQAIIKAVFIYHRGSIRVRSCFCLSGLSTLTSCGKMLHSYDDSLPHPHLVDYNCLGGNLIPIEEAMSSGDWDLAIEQAISATKNINFMDSVVFSTFAQRIDVTRDRRCIILPDDTELTIQEFYDVYAKEFNNI